MNDALVQYPATFKASSEASGLRYRRLAGVYAVRGRLGPSSGAQLVAALPGDGFWIYRGAPPARVPAIAVYSLGPGGSPALPTGRVLVRFAPAVRAAERARELHAAGYRLVQVLDYAPHSAWVEPPAADVATALRGLARLEALPEVVHVEPQVLRVRHAR